jgi:Cation transporting ATPase, C-terminus
VIPLAHWGTQANTQFSKYLDDDRKMYNSVIFNSFIWMQIFNQFNARKINDELNVFGGIWKSKAFLYIMVCKRPLLSVSQLLPNAARVRHRVQQTSAFLTPVVALFQLTKYPFGAWNPPGPVTSCGSMQLKCVLFNRLYFPSKAWSSVRLLLLSCK